MWASDLGGIPADLTIDEVAAVRALLRQPDVASRRAALERMDGWGDRDVDQDSGSAVLRAATQSYPWLKGERADPADRFARVLWTRPALLSVAEVEGAYLIASDRVRRSLLHLLALRRDRDGLASVAFLIGPDGPSDLLPLPTTGLLDPVLDVVSAPSLVPSLVAVASRRGWAWHATDLLRRLAVDQRLDDDTVAHVVDGMVPLVDDLVESCDRLVAMRPDELPPDLAGERPSVRVDPSRADRHRLRAVIGLLAELPVDGARPPLLRALASADPRVAADAAVALVARGAPVASERLVLIARDAEARGTLVDGLEEHDRVDLLDAEHRTGRARAESDLVRWLAIETELGRAPDELEHVEAVPSTPEPSSGEVHLFRFRVRAPHWSSARGWMIGAAGPYVADGTPGHGVDAFASSIYNAEDEDGTTGHLAAILESLAAWPDDRDV